LGYYITDYFKNPLDSKDPEGDFAKRLQELSAKTSGSSIRPEEEPPPHSGAGCFAVGCGPFV